MRVHALLLCSIGYATALAASTTAATLIEPRAAARGASAAGSTIEPTRQLLAHVGAAEFAMLAELLPDARAHVTAAVSILKNLDGVRTADGAASPVAKIEAQAGTRRTQTWLPLADGAFVVDSLDAKPMHGHGSPHLRVTDARVVHVQLTLDTRQARSALEAADRAIQAAQYDEARRALERARAAFVIVETPVAAPTVAALDNLRLARAWLRDADPTAAAASLEHVAEALPRIRPVADGTPTAGRLAELTREVRALARSLSRRHPGAIAHAPGTLDSWVAELERWPLH